MRYRLAQVALLALSLGACTNDSAPLDDEHDADTANQEDADAPANQEDADPANQEDADLGMQEDADTYTPEAGTEPPDDAGREQDAALGEDGDTADADALDGSADSAVDARPPEETGPPDAWGSAAQWTDDDTRAAFDYRCGVSTPSDSSVFLDVGYTGFVSRLALYGDRLLMDTQTSWSLWKRSDRTRIARGDERLLTPGAQVFATYHDGQFVLRSTVDGHTLLTRPAAEVHVTADSAGASWSGGLARDGSYYWYSLNGRIRAVNMDGTAWLDEAATSTMVDAQATRLRIVDGSKLRSYPRAGGAPTEITFTGAFAVFSLEGSRFVTYEGVTARLYEGDGTLAGSVRIGVGVWPGGSVGDWIWTYYQSVALYRLGDGAGPFRVFSGGFPDDGTPWAASASRFVVPGHVVDLATGNDVPGPAPSPRRTRAVTADGTDWVTYGWTARDANGVVIAQEGAWGADENYFGCGPIHDVHVGENGLAFLITPRGVFVFDITTRSMRGFVRVHFDTRHDSQIAEDGSVLFLSDGIQNDDFAVFAIDLASGPTPMLGRPSSPTPTPFTRLSPDGRWLGIFGEVVNLDGSTVQWGSYPGADVPYVSPAGTRVAGTPGLAEPISWQNFSMYDRSGTLLGTSIGAPMKWLSDDVLITGNEQNNPTLRAIGVDGEDLYPGVTCPGAEMGISPIQRLGGSNLYLPAAGVRCNIATGQTSVVPTYRDVKAVRLFGDEAVYVVGSEATLQPLAP